MNINDIIEIAQNRYKNYKNCRLTIGFEEEYQINFIETCLTKEEKMLNRLINTENGINISNYVSIFIKKTKENDYNIGVTSALTLDSGNNDNKYDVIYHLSLDRYTNIDNILKLNKTFDKIDYIINFVFNIKIDIPKINKIFIKTFANELDRIEIRNAITSFKKYEYLDKNNIFNIINVINKAKNKNYIKYRKAIFKLIVKDFKQYLNKVKDIME